MLRTHLLSKNPNWTTTLSFKNHQRSLRLHRQTNQDKSLATSQRVVFRMIDGYALFAWTSFRMRWRPLVVTTCFVWCAFGRPILVLCVRKELLDRSNRTSPFVGWLWSYRWHALTKIVVKLLDDATWKSIKHSVSLKWSIAATTSFAVESFAEICKNT